MPKLVHINLPVSNEEEMQRLSDAIERAKTKEGLFKEYEFFVSSGKVHLNVDVTPILEEIRDLLKELVERESTK